MKRALTFLAVFLAVTIAVYSMVIGFNFTAFETLFKNKDGMVEGSEYVPNTYSLKGLTEFIGDHPEFASITSYNVNDPDSGIFYQSDKLISLGATTNLFLMMEYERQVEAGMLDPEEEIALAEIEKFALPEISINSHQDLLSEFENELVPLDNIVAAMIRNSDLVAADYLWFKLGEENIRNTMDSLSLDGDPLPLPFSGLYASLNAEVLPKDQLENMSDSSFHAYVLDQAYKIKEDPAYNEEIKELFDDTRIGLSFIEERDALKYFPQTTTRELAGMMQKLVQGDLFGEKIDNRIKEKLRWPVGSETIDRSFSDYGAIYDMRMGLLSGIDFGTSVYDGHTSVQAVFFDRLPVAFWLHMSSNHMQEDYQQRLIWDPALYQTTVTEIRGDNE
ncbi:serine hydrolase [Balneola sp. MJW-20]|uniref:serine hydrolase n=1 Tax=Gracilimonas aurantiaca TaxID=3234185 RepID=UPI00346531A8